MVGTPGILWGILCGILRGLLGSRDALRDCGILCKILSGGRPGNSNPTRGMRGIEGWEPRASIDRSVTKPGSVRGRCVERTQIKDATCPGPGGRWSSNVAFSFSERIWSTSATRTLISYAHLRSEDAVYASYRSCQASAGEEQPQARICCNAAGKLKCPHCVRTLDMFCPGQSLALDAWPFSMTESAHTASGPEKLPGHGQIVEDFYSAKHC